MFAVADDDRDVFDLNASPMKQEATSQQNCHHCGHGPSVGHGEPGHCPHHHDYQHLTSHYRPGLQPASEAFKTPGKYHQHTPGKPPPTGSSPASHKPGLLNTPQSSRNGQGYNPFEHDVVRHLHGPMFSPNVFTCNGTSTPRKNENTFVWSIDEQAILFPAEIDNMPHHQEHLNSIRRDDHSEREAQAAIDEFFSSQQIVPSPWIESEQKARTSQSTNPTPSRGQGTSCPSRINRLKNAAKEVGCQTSLSIPMDFDLMSVLGALHNENHSECDVEGDVKVVLSTSGTLRRKLFEHHMTSPSRPTTDDEEVGVSPPSPHLSVPFSPLATPSSTQFSSSPIQSLSSGRMSSSPGYQTGYQSDNGRRHHQISARLFPQTHSGGDLMIGSHSDGASSPLSSPDISPIKFSQKKASVATAEVKFRDQRLDGDSSYDSESPPDLQSADCTDMETSQNDGHQTTGIGNWGLSTIRESIDADDVTDCEVVGSDTGYQTGSIQDSAHHTNLTQQMSHLLPLVDSAQHSFSDSSPRNNSSRNSGVFRKELSRELAKVARVPLSTIANNVQGY